MINYEIEKEMLNAKKEESGIPDSISTVDGEKIPYKEFLSKKEISNAESK